MDQKQIDRINELVTDTVNHEQEKRNLEIKMLQTQISPHFCIIP